MKMYNITLSIYGFLQDDLNTTFLLIICFWTYAFLNTSKYLIGKLKNQIFETILQITSFKMYQYFILDFIKVMTYSFLMSSLSLMYYKLMF